MSILMASAASQAVTINNASFENSFTSWNDTDPSAISGDAYTGSKSAKITGSAGKFTQEVLVDANTNYTLSAYVKGDGEVGAVVDGSSYYSVGGGSDFEQVSVSFNSGSASSITIYGAYGGDDGRFDDFSLEASTTDTPVDPEPETPVEPDPETPDVTVTSSKNDGNGPNNVLDGDLSTRWSANGDGQWLNLNLGTTQEIGAVDIAFYKGNTRTSDFEIEVSTDGSNWNTAINLSSSNGDTLELERFTFDEALSAQYVRFTGYGNSSNTWNSVTEFAAVDCDSMTCSEVETPVDPDPETPIDPDPETPVTGFDWSGWKVTLPVNGDTWYDDGNTSSAAEIQPSGCTSDVFDDQLSNEYFWSDNEGLHFKVPMNLDGKTPNTSYIRSELRELHDWTPCGTTSEANWSYGGDHTLTAKVRIDDYNTDGPKVVVGQIHGHDISYATIKLHWEGDSKPIRVIYNKESTSSTPNNVYLGYVDSSDFWEYTIKMTDTGIELSAGGVTQTITFGNELSNDWKDADFYFKAGLYPQEKPSSSSTDVYEATFSEVTVSH